MDAGGINNEIFLTGIFCDFALHDQRAELPEATQSAEPGFQQVTVTVENLDGGNTGLDEVGIAAAHIPGCLALVFGNKIAGSQPDRVPKGEGSSGFYERIAATHHLSGEDNLCAGGGVFARLRDAYRILGRLLQEKGEKRVRCRAGVAATGFVLAILLAGTEGKGAKESKEECDSGYFHDIFRKGFRSVLFRR
ncbi:MAG: hypothetical protein CMO40_08025 [Verrucomicrobiaceae bacterium]|nr:hypothetical protein [Verrucomicrobiaceae bacterium]